MVAYRRDSIINLHDIHYCRGEHVIFDGVDIEIERGKITAIMGPSGTGKTTLLRLITGQLAPDSGDIVVDGKSVPQLNRKKLYELRRRMGMLFQSGALLTDLSVFENVAFPLREHTRLSETLIRHLVLMKLQAVGLRGTTSMMPGDLSGGMARRVALARTIVMDPQMIFYDEPFTGLDPISMGMILRLVKKLNKALGLTSVIVSHDVAEIATIADQTYLLADGKVQAHGTPHQLANSKSPQVQQFMQGLADGPVPFHYPAPDYGDHILGAEE